MKHCTRENTPLQIYRVNICSSLDEECDAWAVLAHDKDEAVRLLKEHYKKIKIKITLSIR
jgi:predicted small metal-binding protein